MNNTRIRYRLNKETGLQESVRSLMHPTNGERYSITLNEAEKSFKICEELSGIQVAEGRATNLHQVKIKVKTKLVELGILFTAEARNVASKQTVVATQ